MTFISSGVFRRRRTGQGMVEMGLVMGLIAILAIAALWGLSEWLAGTFVKEAEGTGAQNVHEFYAEMKDIADGRQINSTSTTSSTTSTTGTTSTGSTTTSSGSTTTSTGTTSTGSTTTSSGSTTTSSGSTTTSSIESTTSTNTSTTSTTTTTTSTTTTSVVSTSVPSCNPIVTSVRNSSGTCNWTTSDVAVFVEKNSEIDVTVNLGGDTWCVTSVTASTIGNALSSLSPSSDATAPYQFTFKTVNEAGRGSTITFSVMQNSTVKAIFDIKISTANSASCK